MKNFIILLLLVLEFEIIAEKDENDQLHTDETSTKSSEEGEVFTKCYDELGCIETNAQWYEPKYRPVNNKPVDRNIIKTSFVIIRKNSTRGNDLYYTVMTPNAESIKGSGFDKNLIVFILIHDFTGNGYAGWIKHLARVLFKRKKCNIISVDWQHGAEPPYDQAIANARVVALETINMLNVLRDKEGLSRNNVHMIGHGVGAHIAGYVGHVFNGTKKITGLDPSGPRFEGMPSMVRLDRSDAKYVEVVHTDAFEPYSQGSKEHFGDSDFFISNALLQPGCPEGQLTTDLLSVSRSTLKTGEVLPGCSHKRAYKYFIESLEVEECTFLGIGCKNYEDFMNGKCTTCGENCRSFGLITYGKSSNGSYYLQTASKHPYCLYQYRVTIQIKGGKSGYHGYFDFVLIDTNRHITTSPMIEPRDFKPGGENTFVFYAGNPEMGKIREARVGWKEKKNLFCLIYCEQYVNVDKVSIASLNSKTQKSFTIDLCPAKGMTEIQNGDYQQFFPCK